MEWLANNESSLSAIAAIIAIIAGVAVVVRLVWTRMPSQVMNQVKRPAFLSDWRNVALMTLGFIALLAVLVLATSGLHTGQDKDTVQDSDTGQASTADTTDAISKAGKPSVAVLPLDNLSNDPEQAYLADGITEDVITLLSRNPRFFVIARNSSFTYKGKAVDIRQVGEELGVRYVVEGSLRIMGERLRVTVQLIDTNNGQHLWAEQYDRPLAEIFALQDDITRGIAVTLGDEIWSAEISRANSTLPENLDAWGLVMRGSRSYARVSRKLLAEEQPLLREALLLEPNYVPAKAELARSLCWQAANFYSEDPARDIAEAYTLGQQALESAPNDPLALFALGSCYGYTGRPREAIRLLEKAISKQPNYALASAALGLALMLDQQPARGLPYNEQALLLSPRSPQVYLFETFRTATLCELSRYTQAEQAAQNGLKSYDGWYWTWLNLAWARAAWAIPRVHDKLYMVQKQANPGFLWHSPKNQQRSSLKTKARICWPHSNPSGRKIY
ncbi:MAG: tetratricopeptide repeat protein [Porticoccaceae bacterium]|nr:tetratricopeptide repeat protein [Porticoccaceae bacterium]